MGERWTAVAAICCVLLSMLSVGIVVSMHTPTSMSYGLLPPLQALHWSPPGNPRAWQEQAVTSINLRFSGVPGAPCEPSFVYIDVNNRTRMGGLWGVVGPLRTIQCWRYVEGQVNQTHWVCQSYTPWGPRQADFYVQNDSLLLVTRYQLNQSMPVLDWYWEQCNAYGVDQNACVVVGRSDGCDTTVRWHVANIPYVMWIWMRYREWMTGELHAILFTLDYECTVLLREDHGNDVAPLVSVATGVFRTRIQFDVRCPV